MDDKENNPNLQQPNEPSQPIFETVPEDGAPPEEIASSVATTDQTDFTEIKPEIAPIAENTVSHSNNVGKVLIMVGGLGVFFLVFLVLFVALSGGSKKKKSDVPQPVALTYWGLWEEKEVIDPLIKEYQKTHPNVQITYEKKSEVDYRKKLLTWIQNGQGPDIFRFHNTWVPEMLLPDPSTSQMALASLPESVMTSATFEKTFYPIHSKDLIQVIKETNADGSERIIKKNIRGIPLMVDGLVIIVNTDLLKKAGVSTIPTTWDDMVAAASQVVVKGKDKTLITAGIAAGTATNIAHFSDIFGLMLLLNGGDLAKLDQPEAVGALEAYRRFAEEPNNVWNESMPNSVTAFAEGKVAILFAPSWEVHTIKASAPDLKFAVAAIPSLPGGKQFSISSYWVEGVSIKSAHQTEAWQFLAYLASKEGQTKMYEIQSSLRMFGTPYSRIDLADLLAQDPFVGPVIKQAAEDKFISLPLISNTFDDGLNDGVNRYIENAINSASQGVSYNEAMNKAKEGIDQIFAQYKIK